MTRWELLTEKGCEHVDLFAADRTRHVIKQGRENEEKLLCISPFYEYPHLSTDVFVPLKIKIQTMC